MLIKCIFDYFQKKRKVLTINTKMEILTNLENEMKNWEICKKYNVSNSSALHSVAVAEEGSIVYSLWGGVTRSQKVGLVTGNLERITSISNTLVQYGCPTVEYPFLSMYVLYSNFIIYQKCCIRMQNCYTCELVHKCHTFVIYPLYNFYN